MTSPSGGAYEVGDDTVAARLQVDIPSDAINTLTDLGRLTADIRANMEATAKYNQDYVEWLRQLPTVMAEVGAAQAQLSASQGSMFGGGGGSGDAIPRDPFAGRDYGDGTGSMGGRPGSGRPMRGVDQDTLIGLARDNPRQIVNMAADRGLDDYFDDDQSAVLPRPSGRPQPRAGTGRSVRPSGGGSRPSSSRSGTGPGDDDGRSAGTGTGRQVTPEGTESQAERAAKRLLAELDKGADTRDIGQRARGLGDSVQNNSLLGFLNREVSGGRMDALNFSGGLGRMAQDAAQNFTGQAESIEQQRQNLLTQAGEVAATNPALAAQLTQRAQGLAGRASTMGRLMPLAKGAGLAGAGIAAAAGVNAAIQNTGETLHGLQGTGVQMGGGIQEGAAFEASIRTMALNPFISTEQSRKIMQSALQTGYTGKELDTVTDFMAENLKNMNMEVAESTKLLQQNILKGGQSAESVQAQLAQNVGMAGVTNMTADQINQAYGTISGSLIDQGASGAQAGAVAQGLSTLTEGNDILKGDAGSTITGLMNNPMYQSYLGRETGATEQGIPLSGVAAWSTDNLNPAEMNLDSVKAMEKVLSPWINMYRDGDDGAKYRAAAQAAKTLNKTPNEAMEWLRLFATGEIYDMIRENEEKWETQGGGKMNTNWDVVPMTGEAKAVGGAIKDAGSYIRMGWNRITGDDEQAEEVGARRDERSNKRRLDQQLNSAGGPTFTPEVLEQLALQEHGGSIEDVIIVDEEGKERKLGSGDLRNKETMEKLQSGDIKVKSGDNATTLRDWGNTANTDAAGTGGGQQIGLTDEARRFFRLEGPNPVQQQADRGVGSRNSDEAAMLGMGPR